ncbi:hypothetical protein ENUP19_0003G0059 [Entamoeba nuttalli]|uniref:Serine/threonine-protein phosphatase n=2 Tax=Entamoeba nuttalli TaxID=412467 RepID=K2HSP8_ENTNP|nr:serine/threonine protein phosphatase, putative [Entamoeba nuttalli P19]EKE39115.1 serine/threonine protein phosphatase, putative [Entamoeba nuttalli P19]|eukprot:XP_008858543.1 serine/threonine protein phosphatase, putative [Entamoeba nuttalli P19]
MERKTSLQLHNFDGENCTIVNYAVTTIRGWFVELAHPFPLCLISRKEPVTCTVFKIYYNKEMFKLVCCPLFVGFFSRNICLSINTFLMFSKYLDDTPTTQTSKKYYFDKNCFEFNSNLINIQQGRYSKFVFNEEDNAIYPIEITDTLDESVKIASYVLHSLRNNFRPRHGYRHGYGEESHQWKNGVCLLTPMIVRRLLEAAKNVLLKDNNVIRIQPPCYVVGDLHGNYRDVSALCQLFRLLPATSICTCKYLFLGDYVDRGTHQIEVICLLLALKIIAPDTVYLLRGNHEGSRVNGSTQVYGRMSFLAQCYNTFQKKDGYSLWNQFNIIFQYLPFCGVIDNKLFCVHGGIARELCSETLNALEIIDSFQRPCSCEDPLISELLWCDPADSSEEFMLNKKGDDVGFGPNKRGKGTYIFGADAVEKFLKNSGCRYIIRAHQSEEMGIGLRQKARVVTVFSSSHYCGLKNCAAGLLINNGLMTAIIISGKDYVREKKEPLSVWSNSESESISDFVLSPT